MDNQRSSTNRNKRSHEELGKEFSDNSGKTDSKRHDKFEKTRGTSNLGRKYEYMLCAYYALKLCFNEKVIDFKMTSNNNSCGKFDDVTITVTLFDSSTHIFLIQVKHKENIKENETEREKQKKEAILWNYLTSFLNENKIRSNTNFILLTNNINYNLNIDEFKGNFIISHCQPDNNNKLLIIDTVSDDKTDHIFSFTTNNQNSSNSFYLFTKQKNCDSINSYIDELIFEKFGCRIEFINFMGHWSEGNNVITKHDIIVKLAELLLSPYLQEIPEVTEPLSNKAELLKDAIMQFETTLVKDCDASCVAKIWTKEPADSAIVSETSHKFGITTTRLEVGDKINLTAKEFTKVLWFLNKVPLIVKYDEKEKERIRAAIDLLAMETDKQKLVLVGEKLEETISKGIALKSLHDLRKTPFYQKIIAKFQVSLQGRECINLEKFINFDTEMTKLIEIKDLFLMLEKDFSIGKPLPELEAEYIPRTLKHHNSSTFEDKAFKVLNNPVNIVIGKPGMGKSTLMTSLSHQCPPDHWCVRVNLIGCENFFSKENSTETIMDNFLNDEDPFFNKIKATFRENKRIYLLLDGLDEIYAHCFETVLKFVKDISSNGIHVWISSREHLEDKLSNYFDISPITIEELTKENQEKYIEQRLSHYCDKPENDEGVNRMKEEAKKYITRLFKSVNVADNVKTILGVPLLLSIITEIFLKDNTKLEKIMKEDIFVLTKMYKIFFQGKEEHQDRKAGVQNKGALGNRLNYQLKQYELAALETSASEILPKLKLDGEKLNESQEFLEEIRNRDPLGIISQVVGETNKFQAIFSHKSFAEYFACVWLKKNKEKLGLIKDWFFDSYNDNLRLIFDIMLAEDKPLHLAVLYKNPDQVKKNIDHYEDRDEGGRTALHLISSHSYDDHISTTHFSSSFRFTPRKLTIYQILLKKCNPFEKDELFEWNCLDYALRRNSLLLFEAILETKLYEEIDDINGLIEHFGGFDKFIESSCLYGYFHLLKTLIDRKFVENIMDVKVKIKVDFRTRKVTPLHLASLNGNRDIIELLLKKGYKVNVIDEQNWTPLHFACRWGTYDVVINILELGGDLNAVTDKKQTSLHLASQNGNSNIIELLLEKGCKLNVADENNWNPLHVACDNGEYNAVRKILELGGDLNVVTKEKQTLLHLASKSGNTNIIELLLLEKGCKVNVADENNWTPLHIACNYGRYNAVKNILELGGDLNAVTNEKQTPLHIALKKGYTRISELLLEKGCKVNVADKGNWTPLHVACNYGTYDVVIKILELGGDLNAVTNDKQTALHLASKSWGWERKQIVKYLLENGMNINALDDKSRTPLRCACDEKNYPVIEVLLENDAHLDAECRNILCQNFYDIIYHGKVRLTEIILQRLTNIKINNALSLFPSEFPIYLATRDGHLQFDLLLKMAKLIERYLSQYFIDIASSEDITLINEYLITNFDIIEES